MYREEDERYLGYGKKCICVIEISEERGKEMELKFYLER